MSFSDNLSRTWRNMPPVTKHLLLVNLVMWIATLVMESAGVDLTGLLGLHYFEGSKFYAFQVISYMFMHDTSGISHIFFNMFTLVMFGVLLESVMGSRRYLIFYFICGIGAAMAQELVWWLTWADDLELIGPNGVLAIRGEQAVEIAMQNGLLNDYFNSMVSVGASGSVFGILVAFAMLFPDIPLYLFFIPVPLREKYMVAGYAVIELLFGVTGTMSSVAHFAHLGGLVAGFITIWYWRKTGKLYRGY